LEDTAASVHHASPIIVQVDKIEGVSKRKQLAHPVIVTPVALFTGEERKRYSHSDFKYTFVQSAARSNDELDQAASWIEKYAKKHDGRVVTNFDERRPLLSDAPLSYQRLLKGTYERTIIERLYFNAGYGAKVADRIDNVEKVMSSITVTLGNGTVVHGDFVVANSISDSFKRVKESENEGGA
jgi:hypothetical protein